MITKILAFGAFALMVILDVFVVVYHVYMMILHPCFLDLKITAFFVMLLTLVIFTWFVFELAKDVTNNL